MERLKGAYIADDLAIFKTITGNRLLDERNIKLLMGSIKENGYCGAPIVVNERYEIIDGQHRVEACKRLGITRVPFIIIPGASLKNAIVQNTMQKKWTANDYVESLAEIGYVPAKYVLELEKMFPDIKQTFIFCAITGSYGGCNMKQLKAKTLKCDEAEYNAAVRFLTAYREVKDVFSGKTSGPYAHALRWVFGQDESIFYDLIERIKKYNRIIPARSNVRDAVEELSKIYNHNRKAGRKSIIGMYLGGKVA